MRLRDNPIISAAFLTDTYPGIFGKSFSSSVMIAVYLSGCDNEIGTLYRALQTTIIRVYYRHRRIHCCPTGREGRKRGRSCAGEDCAGIHPVDLPTDGSLRR